MKCAEALPLGHLQCILLMMCVYLFEMCVRTYIQYCSYYTVVTITCLSLGIYHACLGSCAPRSRNTPRSGDNVWGAERWAPNLARASWWIHAQPNSPLPEERAIPARKNAVAGATIQATRTEFSFKGEYVATFCALPTFVWVNQSVKSIIQGLPFFCWLIVKQD